MNEYFIHQKAIVDTKKIGCDTRIWPFTHILEGATIGTNCNICEHVFIENNVTVGNDVTIKNGVYIWDGIFIEDNVFIGPCVTFINDVHPRSKVYPIEFEKTIIKKGASLGANSTIMGGLTIGEYATIGAGSVVLRNVNSYEIIAGNPGNLIGYNCSCSKRLNIDKDNYAKCECGLKYKLESNKLSLIL
ncbi:acyltransferase [Tepidibacter hydrothermalis]|uniref:Acyltransferase n=1 Tax=Tepidibacter hydrothermalis TaxID=3036126 RepID=A0ABY8EJV8_9FIRM|nr:acyltransferase [Tepidibacter hydrothermalis]WFD11385.1 acyltransferase [Tepidibacter hydrothermalis]